MAQGHPTGEYVLVQSMPHIPPGQQLPVEQAGAGSPPLPKAEPETMLPPVAMRMTGEFVGVSPGSSPAFSHNSPQVFI